MKLSIIMTNDEPLCEIVNNNRAIIADRDQIKRSQEYIKSVLTPEQYEVLRTKHNFMQYSVDIVDSRVDIENIS